MEIVNKESENLKSIAEVLADENIKNQAINGANFLKTNVSKNWFSAFEVSQKLRIGLQESINHLNALKLYELIYEKISTNGEKRYKVVLNDKQRLLLLEQDIKFYSEKVEILKKEAEKLKNKLKDSH